MLKTAGVCSCLCLELYIFCRVLRFIFLFLERKAKEAEQQIREIARKAREEHRLTCDLQLDTTYNGVTPGVPPGRQSVMEWYFNKERHRKAGLDTSNNVETWFHGNIYVLCISFYFIELLLFFF